MGFAIDKTNFSYANKVNDPNDIKIIRKVPRDGGGNIIYVAGKIERFHPRQNPKTYFLFGENLQDYSGTVKAAQEGKTYQRRGNGGMAGAVAGEPNVIPVITVLRPPSGSNNSDYIWDNTDQAKAVIKLNTQILNTLVPKEHSVVVPVDQFGKVNLGRGIAKLDETAPSVYSALVNDISSLESKALTVKQPQPDYSERNRPVVNMHLSV